MAQVSKAATRFKLNPTAALAALVIPVALLAACAPTPPPPPPTPMYMAPAPAPAPMMVPRARG